MLLLGTSIKFDNRNYIFHCQIYDIFAPEGLNVNNPRVSETKPGDEMTPSPSF